ncbi:uncharacterized protein LOC100907681 [Galendromus occidentalis]|uniref:Uncharacterized protein LOC100907681 n=1 Tax=Galendromus occidentalis TaxID=34638 RepID=A0AAJ6QX92_9ACAR|nr:uncharacterized protein LOC100907681 [Galendromus occidentalis]
MTNPPQTLLERLLMKLHPLDRLNCALTCRLWADVVSKLPMSEEIDFVVRGPEVEPVQEAMVESQRMCGNLIFQRAKLYEFDPKFWGKFGENLRELQLMGCDWSHEVLHSILQSCPNLESLNIRLQDGRRNYCDRKNRESDSYDGGDREPLLRLRHFSLNTEDAAYWEIETLERIIDLMPNLTSLSLEVPRIEHIADIAECMSELGLNLTQLRVRTSELEEFLVKAILEDFSNSLEDLLLQPCSELTDESYDALAACTKLRNLTLCNALRMENRHLKKLALSAPDLEVLEIENSRLLTEDCLFYIGGLTKLRHLRFSACNLIDFSGVRVEGCPPLKTLRRLELGLSSFTSLDDIHQLLSFENLRSLILPHNHIQPEDFAFIIQSSSQLERLELLCGKLSDHDGSKLHLLKNLKSLSLMDADGFTHRTFEKGVGSPDMESLLIDSQTLTDRAMACIATHHARLKHLALLYSEKVSDAALLNLLEHEPNLRTLRLDYCSFWNDTLEGLVKLCPQLNRIWMEDGLYTEYTRSRFSRMRPSIYSHQLH